MIGEGPNTPPFDPTPFEDVPWLADLLPFPPDVAYPLLQSPPPADAAGTYGLNAEAWIESEMGIKLRHWQRWALRLQWAHRGDGTLCYRTVVESTPRRSGKSVRLRSASVYRTAHPELFGEQQLVLLAGKDTAIVLEHHRKTWRWAKERGWELRRRTGAEEIEAPDGSRFVIRGKDSVYGYDVGYGIVDEAHGVHPSVVDDGIEPSLLDRTCPQLHLVSTSHRKASPLMRRRINAGVANGYEDASTLVMVWAAPPGAAVDDPEVWRAANPYWSAEREAFLATKYEQALAGQSDPTDEDPDPIQSFVSQYLNGGWWVSAEDRDPGAPVVSSEEWGRLVDDTLEAMLGVSAPEVVAVESWYTEGACVAAAVRLPGGRVGVRVQPFPDVPSAAVFVASSGAPVVLAGKSIAGQFPGAEPTGGTSRQAVLDLRRMVDDRQLVHDGSAELAEQVLGLRTVASSDGPRLVSKGRCDAVKAAAWSARSLVTQVEAPAIF